MKNTPFTFLLIVTSQIIYGQLTVNCAPNHTEANNTYSGNVSITTTDYIESAAIHTNNTTAYYSIESTGDYILCVNGFEIQMGTAFCGEITSCTAAPTGCFDAAGLHNAFADFDPGSYTFTISGSNVIITTDGLPNHTSPYWSAGHPLDIPPVCTTTAAMAPGFIDDFNGSYSLTVPINPALAASSSSTGLGPIGLAVSGSVIYNDEEGPGMPIDSALPSLDCDGAHTGPQSFHYHLEPISWSQDDEELIGIMSDGFFIYGRKCNSTGTYPTDLDASGGHTSTTQHCNTNDYHYHIQNTQYIVSGNGYYLLFPDDYQGTPNGIM